MKAIIIAAGVGKRLRPLTDHLPKCMLDFNGKSLIQIHLEALRSFGITDISVIKGYYADKINFLGVKYYLNDRYEHNNILNSLFYAEKELSGNIIISYSDIYYERWVLDKLMNTDYDVSIVVDENWLQSYIDRTDHPISEAEKVMFSVEKKLISIGKHLKEQATANGEFIGMMKLTDTGCDIIKSVFHSAKQDFWGKKFHEAKTFEKAYLTDIIQELVERGIEVHCVTISSGWKEIDTFRDYENIKKVLSIL